MGKRQFGKWGATLATLTLLTACGADAPDQPNAANNATPEIAAPVANESNSINIAAPPPPPAASSPKPPAAAKAPPPDYRAIGTEPFWAVSIADHSATLERPDHPPAKFDVVRIDNGDSVGWTGDGFSIRITPGPCSDGMSDAIWSDSVQLATATGTLKGCGGERDDGGKGTR